VVGVLPTAEEADPERAETAPVDGARQALQRAARLDADRTGAVCGVGEYVDELQLFVARAPRDVGRSDAQLLQPPVHPRHEEEVAGAGLDRAGAGEEQVGDGVSDGADAQLVDRRLGAEQVDEVEGAAAVGFGAVEPAERGRHADSLDRGIAAPASRRAARDATRRAAAVAEAAL
jgi:hypothetical protein